MVRELPEATSRSRHSFRFGTDQPIHLYARWRRRETRLRRVAGVDTRVDRESVDADPSYGAAAIDRPVARRWRGDRRGGDLPQGVCCMRGAHPPNRLCVCLCGCSGVCACAGACLHLLSAWFLLVHSAQIAFRVIDHHNNHFLAAEQFSRASETLINSSSGPLTLLPLEYSRW